MMSKEVKSPVLQWLGVVMTMAVGMVVMASIVVRHAKPSLAAEVDIRREASEWAREAGYSSLGVTCLIQEGLYARCSVSVVEKEEPIELSCSNLTGTCERVN